VFKKQASLAKKDLSARFKLSFTFFDWNPKGHCAQKNGATYCSIGCKRSENRKQNGKIKPIC